MRQQQKTAEPTSSDVIRLAHQMYERDRAEQLRQSSLVAAAEEVGIPAEYMAKATAQLQTQRANEVPTKARQREKIAFFMLPVALAVGLLLVLCGALVVFSTPVPAPAVAVQAAPPMAVSSTPTQVAPALNVDHQAVAFSYLEKGQWMAAAEEARLGLQLHPEVADLHWMLGKALFQGGDIAGALASAKEAMRLNPNHTAFPLLLGEVLMKQGKKKDAITAWMLVLKLDAGRNQWDARTARQLIEGARLTD